MKNKRRTRPGLKKRIILIVIMLEIWVICCGSVGCDSNFGGVNACGSGENSRGALSTEGTNSVNEPPTGEDPAEDEPAAEPPADPEQEPGEEPDADPMGAPPSSLDTGSKSSDFILKIAPAAPVPEGEPFIGEDIDPDNPDDDSTQWVK